MRRRRRKLLSLAAVALGITAATVVATLALDVGDQVNHELRSFGANIAVTPAADGLPVRFSYTRVKSIDPSEWTVALKVAAPVPEIGGTSLKPLSFARRTIVSS